MHEARDMILIAALARRRPRQARAVATIRAIRSAAERLLQARPGKPLSTNEIAEVAGVSIGSLYQYFPNKEAIVASIAHHQMDKVFAELMRILDRAAPGEVVACYEACLDRCLVLAAREMPAWRASMRQIAIEQMGPLFVRLATDLALEFAEAFHKKFAAELCCDATTLCDLLIMASAYARIAMVRCGSDEGLAQVKPSMLAVFTRCAVAA